METLVQDYKSFCNELIKALCTPKSYLYHEDKQNEVYYIISFIIRQYAPCILLTKCLNNNHDFPIGNSSVDCITSIDNDNEIIIYVSISPYASCHNISIKRGSYIYEYQYKQQEWKFITFISDTFVNSLWINHDNKNQLYACTNSYGLIQISLIQATDSMKIIEKSCKGPMISGIYKKNDCFYFFGHNHDTKQFGYYYSTNTDFTDTIFISMQDYHIIESSLPKDLLKTCYYLRYWQEKNWIIIPFSCINNMNENNKRNKNNVDAIIILKLNDENELIKDSDTDSNSDSDDDSDSEEDDNYDDNSLNIKIEKIKWCCIDCIDDGFNGQFSVEIDDKSQKLLLISNNNGIAYIDITDDNSTKLEWLYIPANISKNDSSFYVSTNMNDNNNIINASNSNALHLFHFV